MEVWEKVLLADPEIETFLASAHGRIPCQSCHAGDPDAAEKDVAHTDLIARPSDNPAVACNYCHTEVADVAMSLHGNLWGEKNIIAKRMGLSSWDDVSDQVRAGFDRNDVFAHGLSGPGDFVGGFALCRQRHQQARHLGLGPLAIHYLTERAVSLLA